MKMKQSKENRGTCKTMTRAIEDDSDKAGLPKRKKRKKKIQNKKNQKFCLTMTEGILTTTKRLGDK